MGGDDICRSEDNSDIYVDIPKGAAAEQIEQLKKIREELQKVKPTGDDIDNYKKRKEKELYLESLINNTNKILIGSGHILRMKIKHTSDIDEQMKIVEGYLERLIGKAKTLIVEKSKRDARGILSKIIVKGIDSMKNIIESRKGEENF